MNQKLIIPIDHGNRNMKTEHEVFTSGYVESDCRPVMGDYLFYNGKYYILSQQRIPYIKDKTADERFFILTLFAIAMEAKRSVFTPDAVLQVELPVGLPPKHYGALYSRFEKYFTGRGRLRFTYKGTEYCVEITKAIAYPQDYAAVMTRYGMLREYLRESERIGNSIFIDDICANAKGYKLLYELAERKGR